MNSAGLGTHLACGSRSVTMASIKAAVYAESTLNYSHKQQHSTETTNFDSWQLYSIIAETTPFLGQSGNIDYKEMNSCVVLMSGQQQIT